MEKRYQIIEKKSIGNVKDLERVIDLREVVSRCSTGRKAFRRNSGRAAQKHSGG